MSVLIHPLRLPLLLHCRSIEPPYELSLVVRQGSAPGMPKGAMMMTGDNDTTTTQTYRFSLWDSTTANADGSLSSATSSSPSSPPGIPLLRHSEQQQQDAPSAIANANSNANGLYLEAIVVTMEWAENSRQNSMLVVKGAAARSLSTTTGATTGAAAAAPAVDNATSSDSESDMDQRTWAAIRGGGIAGRLYRRQGLRRPPATIQFQVTLDHSLTPTDVTEYLPYIILTGVLGAVVLVVVVAVVLTACLCPGYLWRCGRRWCWCCWCCCCHGPGHASPIRKRRRRSSLESATTATTAATATNANVATKSTAYLFPSSLTSSSSTGPPPLPPRPPIQRSARVHGGGGGVGGGVAGETEKTK